MRIVDWRSDSPEVQAHGELLVINPQLKVGGKVLLAHLAGPEARLRLILLTHTSVNTLPASCSHAFRSH